MKRQAKPRYAGDVPSALPPPQSLRGLELAVMEEVWRLREATVAAVADAINDASGERRAYTTFLTVLRRLDAKALVTRERRGKTDHYAPALERDSYLEARTRASIDELVSTYGERALVHFARSIESLDAEQRAALERLADDD